MKDWDIHEKYRSGSKVYWGLGTDITVLETPSTAGQRFVCLTDRTRQCEHADVIRKHLNAPYV